MSDLDEKEKLVLKKITLKEQGMNLPLGVTDGADGLLKNFSIRPWRLKEEKELGKLVEKNPESSLAQYVSMVLATMCSRIGPHDLEKMKWEERLIVIGQMWMGDVFYTYIMLRRESIGKEIPLKPKCPVCGRSFDFAGDLDSVTVLAAEKQKDAQWEYELKTPFEIRGREVKKLLLGSPRWNTLEMMKDQNSLMNVMAAESMILGSIQAIDDSGESVVIVEGELDEMTKFDLEKIQSEIDQKVIGPNMFVEATCENVRCRHEFQQTIDWRYQSFFGISSR